MHRNPGCGLSMDGIKGLIALLHIKAHGVDDAKRSSHSATDRCIIGDVRPDELQRRCRAAKDRLVSPRMARRNAHGKAVIEKMLNDTPAQKAGATENSDFKSVRHRVRVPVRG